MTIANKNWATAFARVRWQQVKKRKKMEYKTKSYWLLPFNSILCKSYSVKGKELIVRKWNGDEKAIPL